MKPHLLGLSDAEILAMHAAADMPPNVLDPVTVRDLVERLTDTEAEQLQAYADQAQFPRDWPIRASIERLTDTEAEQLQAYADQAQFPRDWPIRASSWLIRRFDLHANHAKGASR